jgi:tetratricopeptide (TPR) repeat protein
MISAALALKLSSFLTGLGQKCIVAAIKKYKEAADRAAEEETAKTINEFEAAKAVATKIEQRITASLRHTRLTSEQAEQLLAVETNPVLKEELSARFAASDISAESIVELFVKQDAALESAHEELLLLASTWLDAMDKAVGDDAALSRILNLRAHRRLRSELSSMGDHMAKAELRGEQQHSEIMAAVSSLTARLGRTFDSGPSSEAPDHLKSQNQRRFDRARTHLVEGSVITAEHEYRGLIEDLQALGAATDSELLQRSYMNLAASLWEQNKHSDAAPWLDKASEMQPEGWRAKRSRALSFLARGDRDGALPFLRAVRDLKPDDVDHLCNEAWALKNCGRTDEALEVLRTHEFPDSIYFATLSLTYLRAERYDEAEQAARKALSLDPEGEVAQSALAYVLGIPIINLRQQRRPLRLEPTQEERTRLLEAIKVGEQAATVTKPSSAPR